MKTINYLYIISALLLVSCSEKATENESVNTGSNKIELTPAQLKNVTIEYGTLSEQTIAGELKVTGKIDVPPQNLISVSVPFGGYLKSTHLLPGMHIRKGEVIATIEDQYYIQLQQEYLIAKARFGFLEGEYKRQKEMNQSKASSDKAYQQAEADFVSHKIMMKSLAEKLKLLTLDPEQLNENNLSRSVNIYAPITGVVSKVNANIGKYIPAAEILFELINPTDIHLNMSVFEKDLENLYIGQRMVAYSNHHPEIKLGGEIILISSDLHPDRTAEVHCHFDKNPTTLIPGMYMNALISLSNRKVQALPEDAIVSNENKKYVYIGTGKESFEMLEVREGMKYKGYVEILNPENIQGKKVVCKGAYALLMKMKNVSE